jgi:hypothetical protein
MKIRYALLATVLTLFLSLPAVGQPYDAPPAKTNIKKQDMSGMMENPTVDATVEGLRIQAWLMTQKEHKEMMQENMGQMMMHGKKEGATESMQMKGMEKAGMGMGTDMKVMKPEGLGKGKDVHVKKLERLGKRNDMLVMKPDSSGMRKDMKVVEHESMDPYKSVMDSMMAGTHHLGLDVSDAASGKHVANAGVTVLIVSPSKKSFSVALKPMMSHFGGALTLDEKGTYQFAVNVTVSGVSRTTQFAYAVK